MNHSFRRLIGCVALMLSCIMIGSALTLSFDMTADAETTTVIHTSPFTSAVAQVKDSVVGVSNYQNVTYRNYGSSYGGFFDDFFGNSYGGRSQPETREELASTGSGVVVGEGFVLTNYHVVEDAVRLEVTVTDDAGETTEYAASLVAFDKNLDAAVLYAPDCKLPAVALGDSDSMMVGDWAICIGNPLGFAKTTTVGVVSALNRGIENESYDKYGRRQTTTNAMIQVDAAINSGNSGGGMFSVTGELMGIPTLKYSGSYYSGSSVEGIGMCIPVNAVKPLINSVLSGEVKAVAPEKLPNKDETSNGLIGKPRLGISIKNVNTASSAARLGLIPDGLFITEVEAGSPAEQAGLMAGDIIVDVNDTVITDTEQLISKVEEYKAGDTLTVKVYRIEGADILSMSANDDVPDGEYIDAEVTLAIVDTPAATEAPGLIWEGEN